MNWPSVPKLPLVVTAALLIALATAHADDDRDDAARAYREALAGEILPLTKIIGIAKARYPGEILEVELEDDDGEAEYGLHLLLPDGRVVEIEIDARTGRILDVDEDD